jgi:hypothetical protein
MEEKTGITLSATLFKKIQELCQQWQAGQELEVVFKHTINKTHFKDAMSRMLRICGSANMKSHAEVLDINVAKTGNSSRRLSINGLDHIVSYCRLNAITETMRPHIHVIDKAKVDQVIDVPEYNLRIRLASETPINDPTEINNLVTIIPDVQKHYRLKKRYSIITPDRLFRIDFTIVRSSEHNARSLVSSKKVHSATEHYEIELEFIGDDMKRKDAIIGSMFDYVTDIIGSIEGEHFIMSTHEKKTIIDQYIEIVKPILDAKQQRLIDIKHVLQNNPKLAFIGPQMVTLERKHLLAPEQTTSPSILRDYTVTEKADGRRMLVFVNPKGDVYLISNLLNPVKTGIHISKRSYHNSIFDCEMVRMENGKVFIMCFDAYIVGGQNVGHLPLASSIKDADTRNGYVELFVNDAPKASNRDVFEIRAKQFYMADATADIYKQCKKILDKEVIGGFPYATDGLIFTPASLPVGAITLNGAVSYGGTWVSVFKWKPPVMNTIDFYVETKKYDGRQDDFIGMDDKGRYKILYLYVVGRPTTPADFFMNNGKSAFIKKLFMPTDQVSDNVYTCKVRLSPDSDVMKCAEIIEEIEDRSVVEMAWDVVSKEWVPNRVRHDKTEETRKTGNVAANAEQTAMSVWTSILHPVQSEHITGRIIIQPEDVPSDDNKYYGREVDRNLSLTYGMMEFHNQWVKNKMLYGRIPVRKVEQNRGASRTRSIMDIACGKGGDISKCLANKFDTYLGVDLFEDNIINPVDGAYKRMVERRIPKHYNYVFLPIDASKKIDLGSINNIRDDFSRHLARIVWGHEKGKIEDHLQHLNGFANKGFDVVSCQFAIHYFFETDDTLRTFIENVDAHLNENGYFIGTCFDGDAVANTILNKAKYGEKVEASRDGRLLWSISRLYENDYDPKKTGQRIKVYVESINKNIDEFLVGFERLQSELAKKNIRLVDPLESRELFGIENGISTGLFDGLYNEFIQQNGGILSKANVPKEHAWMKAAQDMTADIKRFSFINRWFIFKKYTNMDHSEVDGRVNLKSKGALAVFKDMSAEKTIVDEDITEPLQKVPTKKKTLTTRKTTTSVSRRTSNDGEEPKKVATKKKATTTTVAINDDEEPKKVATKKKATTTTVAINDDEEPKKVAAKKKATTTTVASNDGEEPKKVVAKKKATTTTVASNDGEEPKKVATKKKATTATNNGEEPPKKAASKRKTTSKKA